MGGCGLFVHKASSIDDLGCRQAGRYPQTGLTQGCPPANTDYVLAATHVGTVHVESGHFVLAGTLMGTLHIHSGVTASITGRQQGTVTIGHGSTVTVTGAIQGTTNVEHGATLIIEAGGKLAGALRNDGQVIVRGVFGGPQTGAGQLKVEGGGYIKQPTIRGGVTYYEW